MLFFQTMLLAGYAYAAILVKVNRPLQQAVVHFSILVISLFFLPIDPSDVWKPIDGDYPTARILFMLMVCIGLPYFLLAATSTLIQTWIASVRPGKSPYRLYTLSNIGSLGALLSYPLCVEPTLNTQQQGWVWSAGFVLLVVGLCALVFQLWYLNSSGEIIDQECTTQPPGKEHFHEPSWQDRVTWFLLPALGSAMLLSVTNYLCQDVAVIPFLWVAPLSIYLISFIICFDGDSWYRPRWFSFGTVVSIIGVIFLSTMEFIQRYNGNKLAHSAQQDIRLVVGIYLSMFFFICMLCHGETVKRKPSLHRLSEFYLTMAGGGALGAIVVTIICPILFSTYLEFNIGIGLSLLLAFGIFIQNAYGPLPASYSRRMQLFLFGLTLSVLIIAFGQWWVSDQSNAHPQVRNFYGTLSVREFSADEPEHHGVALFHGTTMHGFQFKSPTQHNQPTAYFTEDSGVGMAFAAMRPRGSLKIGVVGLGIGTLAAYGKPGDSIRFYEINPLVVKLAQQSFTFLQNSAATIEIVPGDARLSLEREASLGFDLLILDAFSSDAVPVHLLTDEAVELYLKHVKSSGLIAFQVTNRHLDLISVVARHAQKRRYHSALIRQDQSVYSEKTPSVWFLMTQESNILSGTQIGDAKSTISIETTAPVWTDNHHNLFQILKVSNR